MVDMRSSTTGIVWAELTVTGCAGVAIVAIVAVGKGAGGLPVPLSGVGVVRLSFTVFLPDPGLAPVGIARGTGTRVEQVAMGVLAMSAPMPQFSTVSAA